MALPRFSCSSGKAGFQLTPLVLRLEGKREWKKAVNTFCCLFVSYADTTHAQKTDPWFFIYLVLLFHFWTGTSLNHPNEFEAFSLVSSSQNTNGHTSQPCVSLNSQNMTQPLFPQFNYLPLKVIRSYWHFQSHFTALCSDPLLPQVTTH